MEKEDNKNFYMPFNAAMAKRAPEVLNNLIKGNGYNHIWDESQRALMLAISKMLETGENILGPLYQFQDPKERYSLPSEWRPIAEYLTDKRLVKSISFEPLFNDEIKIIRVGLNAIFDENFSLLTDGRHPRTSAFCHGDAPDPKIIDEAVSKAIGEFLERYSLLLYKEKDLLRASSQDLEKTGQAYLDPDRLAGFSDEQKARNVNFQFDKKSDFLWIEGNSLFCKEKVLLPAQLVFWNYNLNHQNWKEPFLREPNTNGAGGHFTFTQAMLSGLYEIIQRDGFLIYWLNKKGPPQIDLETIDWEPLKDLLGQCARLNFEIRFFNTTTELGIPSCICAVIDKSDVGPKISVGGGCEMDWDKMLLRSFCEASGVYHWSRRRNEINPKQQKLERDYKPFQDNKIAQIERIDLLANPEMSGEFQFFLEGEKQSLKDLKGRTQSFDTKEEELSYLVEKFKALGSDYEILYYEAQNEILKKLGYSSVKVLVPALVHLYLTEIFAPLGAKRLKEVPPKLGFAPAKEWNSFPHPFP